MHFRNVMCFFFSVVLLIIIIIICLHTIYWLTNVVYTFKLNFFVESRVIPAEFVVVNSTNPNDTFIRS